MRITIEVNENLEEECVIIKCRKLDEKVMRLQEALSECTNTSRSIPLHKGEKEYYVLLDDILFFETENKQIYAHTKNEIFQATRKLYELEEALPGYFMRVSKSTIANLNHIYSITKNITASSLVEFEGSHKHIYVSRNYYKALVDRLAEKRNKI